MTSLLDWGAMMDGGVYGRAGDAPWDGETWRQFAAHAGRWPSIVHYGQPWGEFFPAPLTACWSEGATPLISVGGDTPLADVAAGAIDGRLEATGRQIAAAGSQRVVLRPWWEFNGDWFSWGKDPANYGRAWRRARRIVREHAPNAEFAWCANVAGGSVDDPAPYFPGREHVDVLGLDGYCRSPGWWQWPGELLGPTARRLREVCPGRELWVCETACVEDPRKPEWTRRLLEGWAPRNRARVVWFNWNIQEEGTTRSWAIESSPAAQAAFRAAINSGAWAGRTLP